MVASAGIQLFQQTSLMNNAVREKWEGKYSVGAYRETITESREYRDI
jgi:hypothetical protein